MLLFAKEFSCTITKHIPKIAVKVTKEDQWFKESKTLVLSIYEGLINVCLLVNELNFLSKIKSPTLKQLKIKSFARETF